MNETGKRGYICPYLCRLIRYCIATPLVIAGVVLGLIPALMFMVGASLFFIGTEPPEVNE